MGLNQTKAKEGSTALFNYSQKKEKVIFIFYFVIILLLIIVRYVSLDVVNTWNWQLITLQKKVSDVERQNLLIKAEILDHSSLNTIYREASKSGMVETW